MGPDNKNIDESRKLEAMIKIIFTKEHDNLLEKFTFKLIKKEDKTFLEYPHCDTLIDLFSTIHGKPDLKEQFVRTLGDRIVNEIETINFNYNTSEGDDYGSAVGLSFFTLVRLGFTKEALDSVKSRGRKSSPSLVKLLIYLLKESSRYFELEELNDLLTITSTYGADLPTTAYIPEKFNKLNKVLRSQILEESYNLVKKQIKGVNVEINLDKKNLSEKISYLGFDENYNRLLIEIDEFLLKDNSSAVTAGMINNLREFMGELFSDVAKKIASLKSEEIPKYKDDQGNALGNMGNIRTYLKINLELSDKDNKFINSFIDVLHAEGGHSFSSNREYFRLSRNIAIEIALLILSKYEKKFKKQ